MLSMNSISVIIPPRTGQVEVTVKQVTRPYFS